MKKDNNRHTEPSAQNKKQLGFTLIEILVALTITSIALIAGAKASMSLSNNSERIGNLLLAQICAENQMIKVRLEKQMPSIGESDFDCTQGQKEFTGKVKIQTTPNPNFRRMDVQVLDKVGPVLSLSTIVGKL